MQDALIFVFRSLLDLYVMAFVLRLMLQWSRADFRNPLSQFILRITSPLVIPLRRVVPAIGMLDTATLVVALVLQLAATAVLVQVACVGSPEIGQLIGLALLKLVQLTLRIYVFAIIAYVVLSWISPGVYNPATALIAALVEPVLAPFRRVIPPIGGIDLSPLFAIIALQALTLLLPAGRLMGGLVCTSLGQPL